MGEEDFNLPVGRDDGENPSQAANPSPTLEGAYRQLLEMYLRRHPDGDRKMLDAAFELARDAHGQQRRESGEPYFLHPLAVAKSLIEWNLDTVSIVCGLLHDTVEDTRLTRGEIAGRFGAEVAEIVDGLTKLSKVDFRDRGWLNAENLRKLLVAIGKDVRVLLVKLADRLHNMRTLGIMREEKRRRIAHETMELYAPLANRLGMGRVYMELEDLSFEILEPESYHALSNAVQAKALSNATMSKDIQSTLEGMLAANGVKAVVLGRVKHLYSIWRMLGTNKHEMENVYDWLSYQVVCPDRASCYVALGIIHALYKPIPGRFKDYISLPKDNGYQSIHTSALAPTGDSFAVQIRTNEMHVNAESGIASNWKYRDGRIANREELNQAAFLRRMMELHSATSDSNDLLVNLKGELVSRQIQVFTPKGELKSLPEGSTPIDFAYGVHTAVGHQCVGAKVNGRSVQLRHTLKNGDIVEVLTRTDSRPSREWLAHVKSASAKAKIQAFIREEERRLAIAAGRERLEREARLLGIDLGAPQNEAALASRLEELKMGDAEAFHAAVGFNRIPARSLLEPLLPDERRKGRKAAYESPGSGTLVVDETIGRDFLFSGCCKPIWGDDIVGYASKGRRVRVHRVGCPAINADAMPKELRVSVAWGRRGRAAFDSEVAVATVDRPGLLAAISQTMQQSGISIRQLNASTTEEGSATIHIAMQVADREHLVQLMGRIRQLEGVASVERVKGSAFGKKRQRKKTVSP